MIPRNVNSYQIARRHIPVVTSPHIAIRTSHLPRFRQINQDTKNKTLAPVPATAPPSVNVLCTFVHKHIIRQKHNYEPVLLGALTRKGTVFYTRVQM